MTYIQTFIFDSCLRIIFMVLNHSKVDAVKFSVSYIDSVGLEKEENYQVLDGDLYIEVKK